MHLSAARNFPDALHNAVANPIETVMEIHRGADMIGKNAKALPDTIFVLAARNIEMSVLFRKRNKVGIGIFAHHTEDCLIALRAIGDHECRRYDDRATSDRY